MKSKSFTRIAFVSLLVMAILGGASQAFAVRVSNDDVGNAKLVPNLPYIDTTNTSDATASSHDPAHSCVYAPDGGTVWYKFTPRRNVHVAANTFGSSFDTVLSVWKQEGIRRSLSEVACNDDTLETWSLQSSLDFHAVANETYLIRVGSFAGGPGGDLTLNLHRFAPAR